LREPYFVPATKKIDDLFFDLQKSKKHMAILIDEYGGFSGIVTMEDIIEEVMGDIIDEYDDEEPEIEQLDESTYMISGLVGLDDLNEQLGINLESDNIETIGGFIIDILGEIPADDDAEALPRIDDAGDEQQDENPRIVEYNNLVFTIESVKERRIEKVKLHIMPEEALAENEEPAQ
jgi:putative hemolysin